MATKARERFRREVGILSERVEHRSVVVLFDWDADSDAPWYISERGDPFNAWWRDWKEQHRADPEAVVTKAIDVVRQLASALGKCHENGVVHRDVKPPNVVVKRGVAEPWPILIDFGVAYENDTPRLTESDEKVGNRRFSPDPARSRLEPVPPWLDVFALAQLVMWMLDEQLSEQKSWPRPLHWRYAKYDSGVGGDTLLAITAFTAACAFESASPGNGSECVELLGNLFPTNDPPLVDSLDNPLDEMGHAKRRGLATKKLVEARIAEEVASGSPLAEVTYRSLRDAILSAVEEIRAREASVRVTVDSEFRFNLVGATDLLWLEIGPSDVNIQLRVKGKVMPASDPLPSNASDVRWWRKHLPKDAICFAFAIEGGVVQAYRNEYLDGRWITIGGSGGIYIHDLDPGFGSFADNNLGGSVAGPAAPASMHEVRSFALSMLSNGKYWEYVAATSSNA